MKSQKLSPKEYLARSYERILIPDSETNTYTAMISEFPGCIAEGSTPTEAYQRLDNVAESWIEAALDLGQVIPEPRASNDCYSGKLLLRMPKSLHRDCAKAAQREGTSLNQFILAAVAEKLGASNLYADLAVRMLAAPSPFVVHYYTQVGRSGTALSGMGCFFVQGIRSTVRELIDPIAVVPRGDSVKTTDTIKGQQLQSTQRFIEARTAEAG